MNKKMLMWILLGLGLGMIITSIILAFVAPGYLITLWSGAIVGIVSGALWQRLKKS